MTYTLTKESSDKYTIKIHKNLNESIPQLIEEVDSLIKEGIINFEVNLKDTTYISSTGLNVLLSILTKSRIAGGDTCLSGMNEKIANLLMITKLNQLFTLIEN